MNRRPGPGVGSWAAVVALLAAPACSLAAAVSAEAAAPLVVLDTHWQQARAAAARIGAELAGACPLADPASEPAFDGCRKALFGDSVLRRSLKPVALWGRERLAAQPLRDSTLTQFAPDVLAGMYLPLFMFDGRHEVAYVAGERMFQFRFRAAFRNRLGPGQFPYPFWHEADKWAMYQGTREVLMWWDPLKAQVAAAQFTVHSRQAPLLAQGAPAATPAFDGKWMWTDASGQAQPKVTLFDGLYSADNPHLARLDASYRALALRLREGQCDQCHVPDNPSKAKRLVLLQTPAHAAAEIRRVLESIRKDAMPLDDAGFEAPLAAPVKQALLREGEAFASVVDAARRWEAEAQQQRLQAAAARPADGRAP